MKRYIFPLVCAALLANAGCCWHKQQCSPCGGGGYGYGATYAPSYAPSTCPGGNCGPAYQSGAVIPSTQQAYIPATQQAYTPYTSTASLNYLPAY